MEKLYYLRHGITKDLQDKVRGRPDTPLVARGRLQAVQAGIKLKNMPWQPDVIFCSPYPRTNETAHIVAHIIGYPEDKIEKDPLLHERNWGVFTGLPNSVVKTIFDQGRLTFDTVPGAETVEQVQVRAATFYQQVLQRPESNILVVGHGTYGRALRRVINGEGPDREYSGEHGSFTTGNLVLLYP